MKNKHLTELVEHNWFNEPRFVSRNDAAGRWIFGDGTYMLILKGKPYVQEGEVEIMDALTRAVEVAKEKKIKEIKLPSKSYLKKLNASHEERLVVRKIEREEIFVDTRMLYWIMKTLGKICAYKTKLPGHCAGKSGQFDVLFLEGENGTGVLMAINNTRERIFCTGRIEEDED